MRTIQLIPVLQRFQQERAYVPSRCFLLYFLIRPSFRPAGADAASSVYARITIIAAASPTNAAWSTSIAIAIGLPAGPALPVMGFPGIRVII